MPTWAIWLRHSGSTSLFTMNGGCTPASEIWRRYRWKTSITKNKAQPSISAVLLSRAKNKCVADFGMQIKIPKNRPHIIWLRGQDLNLQPPGYEGYYYILEFKHYSLCSVSFIHNIYHFIHFFHFLPFSSEEKSEELLFPTLFLLFSLTIDILASK